MQLVIPGFEMKILDIAAFKLTLRPREMAQQLRALPVLAEDLDPIPSTHMATRNRL